MSDLPKRLRALAATLEKQSGGFEGKHWNKALARFASPLAAFERAVEDAAGGLAPGMKELERLFESPDRKVLDEDAMKQLFKKVLGQKAPDAANAANLRKVFLGAIKSGQGSAKKALAAAEETITESRSPKEKTPKDFAALQREVLRLGALDEATIEKELDRKFSDKADLKRLAEAAGILAAGELKKKDIARRIIATAQRVHGHLIG